MKQSSPLALPLGPEAELRITRVTTEQVHASLRQAIAVYATNAFGHLYSLDGDAMAAEGDEFMLHESLVHPAALPHPAPRRALILGGGDGASARELLKHPSLADIVIAELDPDVPRVLAREIPTLPAAAFTDPRVSLRFGDAADTLDAAFSAGERFDLILFDLTTSDTPACAHLHGDDFLRLCRASLTTRGIIQVQLGSPFYQPQACANLYRRLGTIFPYLRPALVSVPLYGGPWLLVRASAVRFARETPVTLSRRIAERRISDLRYYNPALHLASQALPNYVIKLLA